MPQKADVPPAFPPLCPDTQSAEKPKIFLVPRHRASFRPDTRKFTEIYIQSNYLQVNIPRSVQSPKADKPQGGGS